MRSTCPALNNPASAEHGFTLIEMMIAITLGLLVLAGVSNVFTSTIGTNSLILKKTRLNQDISAAMEFMARDLQRSGYFSGDAFAVKNPFQDELSVAAGAIVASPAANCILFAYDTKKDGSVQPEDELGFRLKGSALQLRRAAASCDAAGSWENITDPATVNIKTATFTITPVFCTDVTTVVHSDCLGKIRGASEVFVITYDVAISLTAEAVGDATVTVTANQVVRIKNETVTKI